jgi:hypothetical protein
MHMSDYRNLREGPGREANYLVDLISVRVGLLVPDAKRFGKSPDDVLAGASQLRELLSRLDAMQP